MKRRHFLAGLGAGALATGLAACARDSGTATSASKSSRSGESFKWKMVTTWPPGLPGLGTGATFLARIIGEMSGGRLEVKVYAAGELVPAFEIFDAVSDGTAEMGHGAAYYWRAKTEAAQFFAAVPFGMNAQEINAWLYHGGGMALWRELYEPFGLIPTVVGNSGVQMGGWFKREINSLDDLQGLKMRIPGLGGEILRRAGGVPVTLPGGEIYTALQTGVIDATEWVGPSNDFALGLHNVAKYYYYPGWQEPGPAIEGIINKRAFETLPPDLQAIVMNACAAANVNMLSEYTALNTNALDTLVREHDIEVRSFPRDMMVRMRELTTEVLEELADRDPVVRRIYGEYLEFQRKSGRWLAISEQAYLNTRGS